MSCIVEYAILDSLRKKEVPDAVSVITEADIQQVHRHMIELLKRHRLHSRIIYATHPQL